MKEIIYLDNAATTMVDARVLKEMLPFFNEKYGNASSLHAKGQEAGKALQDARLKVAGLLGCLPEEIIFTSCGSESNNLALKGTAEALKGRGKHIISTRFEHPSVLNTLKELVEGKGFEVTLIGVDEKGFVKLDELKKAVRKDTILASVMLANNEVGSIQPMAEIIKIVKAVNPDTLVHSDAVQGLGKIKIGLNALGIDLMSFSGHKIHAPKGVGVLYRKKGIKLKPLIQGGGQEQGLRSGTENIAFIAGFAKALELALAEMQENNKRMLGLKKKLVDCLLERIPESRLNGSMEYSLPNIANVSFPGAEGESILFMLDALGICVSTGSACSQKSLKPSHVLQAMGLNHLRMHGSIRFSLSRFTQKKEIDFV
ncbi:cysteine desulfurase, partial [archaeon]|nr:cysteine desulfurase [archaeon]